MNNPVISVAATSAKERYHIAKLALFNIRLLHRIQISSNSEVRVLVEGEASKNGFNASPPLLHQATYLQFAYICLVWLLESAKQEGLENALLAELPNAIATLSQDVTLPSPNRVQGCRVLSDWAAVLRLLRNALSHGRVEATEKEFIFSDQNTRGQNAEPTPTFLTITWAELGVISEACIHALTPSLWPQIPA